MQAIVLQRRDAGEYDRAVSLFSRERGKVEAFIKGVKKITGKNGPFLEPFFFIEAETISGKDTDKLTKAYPLASFKNIRADMEKMRLAGYAAYFIDICTQAGGKSEDIFDLFLSWLKFLDRAKSARVNLLYGLMIKIYAHLGFAPELSACARCGKPLAKEYKKIFFSVSEGGIICSACRTRLEKSAKGAIALTASEYKFLRTWLNGGWELINRLKKENFEKKIRRLVFDFIQYRAERKLAKFSEI